jgi:repressor of nif and glnA expression
VVIEVLGDAADPMGATEIAKAIEHRYGVAMDEPTVRRVLSRSKQAREGRFVAGWAITQIAGM